MENMRAHIETLGRNGAKIRRDKVWIPVTVELYEEALESCRKNHYTAMAWEMKIPETEETLMLCIKENGHVDSGSEEHICKCLDLI